MTESEATDLDQRPPSADYVLDLLSEYEDTHDSIADRLLGRLVGVNPAVALEHLEATKAHLDKRLVRSAAAPDTSGDSLSDAVAAFAGVSPDLVQVIPNREGSTSDGAPA